MYFLGPLSHSSESLAKRIFGQPHIQFYYGRVCENANEVIDIIYVCVCVWGALFSAMICVKDTCLIDYLIWTPDVCVWQTRIRTCQQHICACVDWWVEQDREGWCVTDWLLFSDRVMRILESCAFVCVCVLVCTHGHSSGTPSLTPKGRSFPISKHCVCAVIRLSNRLQTEQWTLMLKIHHWASTNSTHTHTDTMTCMQAITYTTHEDKHMNILKNVNSYSTWTHHHVDKPRSHSQLVNTAMDLCFKRWLCSYTFSNSFASAAFKSSL